MPVKDKECREQKWIWRVSGSGAGLPLVKGKKEEGVGSKSHIMPALDHLRLVI